MLREILLNAITHRNYLMNACIQVSIFDNRLEITSPGSLYGGLTLEQALEGNSVLRNPGIAEVFAQAKLIESWGTGLQRIKQGCIEHGLPEPEFLESSTSFRIVIYRQKDFSLETVGKNRRKEPSESLDSKRKNLQESMDMILDFMDNDISYTRQKIMFRLGIKESRAREILRQLVQQERIYVLGKGKSIRYQKSKT